MHTDSANYPSVKARDVIGKNRFSYNLKEHI